jgi:hypothetical protein
MRYGAGLLPLSPVTAFSVDMPSTVTRRLTFLL